MTNSKLLDPTSETSTVVVDDEKQTAAVTSPKYKATFFVRKVRSALFFEVVTDKGSVPKVLSGKYTSIPKAVQDIEHYIRQANETFSVKSDRLAEYRKNAKTKPEDG